MIYHPKIEFRNRSNYDEKLIVSTFNPDSGETDTYLTMEPVYSESYDGAMRTDYGAKYTDVAKPSVTFIDIDGEDIQAYKVRSVLRWLTGSRQNAWMNVYNIDGDIVCSYLGRFTDVKLQKMDARVIGIVAYFTATTPWAYSDVQTVTMQLNGATNFSIDNESDELYSLIYPRIIYKNTQNNASLSIKNNTVGKETVFKKLQQGEIITIDNNFVAYSDNTSRIFNDDFNFVFPALSAGLNDFKAEGIGELTISFRYPMKVSDGLLNSYEIKKTEPSKNALKETWASGTVLRNNASGYTGVSFVKTYKGQPYNKWRAYIEVDGKRTYLGDFEKKKDAVAARKEAGEKGVK